MRRLWRICLVVTLAGAQLAGKSCDDEAGPPLTVEEANACKDPLREETKLRILKHLERVKLPSLGSVDALGRSYRARKPFPHAVFDDMIPKTVLERLSNRWNSRRGQSWNVRRGEDVEQSCLGADGWRCIKKKSKNGHLKMTLSDETRMHPISQGVMAALKAPSFVRFLEQVSGISPLYPDPFNEGGGLHETGRGGLLQIHADFRRHPITALERRVNAFVYLNDDWNATWNGDLELWHRDMSKCAKKIATSFGRFVMFSSHDFSYHGHAEPLECPEDRSRKSMAFYYYSPVQRPADTIDLTVPANHTTLYQSERYASTPCGSCSSQYARKLKSGTKCEKRHLLQFQQKLSARVGV